MMPSGLGDAGVKIVDIRTSHVTWLRTLSAPVVEKFNTRLAQITGFVISFKIHIFRN